MVVIRECDTERNVLKPKNAEKGKELWDQCMRECKDEFNHIIKKVYDDIYASSSDSDFKSSSSGSIEVRMKITYSFDEEVMSYDHSSTEDVEIGKLRSLKNISSSGNYDDILLEPCIPGECVSISRPKCMKDEFFNFYVRVLENFKIRLPFSDFEADILKTTNVVPSLLRPNSWGFIKAFEIIFEAMRIDPTIGLFFFFFEVKEVEKAS